MFSTALLECIYHLILAMRAAPSDEEHAVSMKSFQLAYQLLDQFSQVLYTAKRALRALNSVVSLAAVTNSKTITERPSPCSEAVQDCSIDLSFCTANNMDFFDPMSWQLDDIPLDVVALVSNMGDDGSDFPNGLSEQSLDSDFCLWNIENGGDEVEQFDITL